MNFIENQILAYRHQFLFKYFYILLFSFHKIQNQTILKFFFILFISYLYLFRYKLSSQIINLAVQSDKAKIYFKLVIHRFLYKI